MELKTISQVSRDYGVTTRALRYYEQIGLLRSRRTEDYAYRVYDDSALQSLRQIVILRKLRIPLEQIRRIFQSPDALAAAEVFARSIAEIDTELDALSTLRSVLERFAAELRRHAGLSFETVMLMDSSMLETLRSLPDARNNLKEAKSMDDLSQASEALSALKDVRILHLPPCTVAASHYVGEEPESGAWGPLEAFIKSAGLCGIKPDARVFGFNHPNPSKDKPVYGYEFWVTIPEELEVPSPLIKKQFAGGLYAAHVIAMGAFHEWGWLDKWVKNNGKYRANCLQDGGECMHGLLEEHLNYIYKLHNGLDIEEDAQVDLLYPVVKK